MNIHYVKNAIFSALIFTLLIMSQNTSASSCSNDISSNMIDEDIAISDTEKISISPWPVIQLDTSCVTQGKWNITSSIAYNENGDGAINNISSPYLSQASVIFSKGDYAIEAGRYLNNFSYNSVFGMALPMKTIPAIQLDEASYLQTVSPDVLLVRFNIKAGGLNTYITGYQADKTFEKKSTVDRSYNVGVSKQFFENLNIELQYANEAVENSSIREKRTSFFVNASGVIQGGVSWVIGAEVNDFKNRNYINGDNDTTANLYSEISKEDIFVPNINAYILTGGGIDKQNRFISEIGVFLNMARLLNIGKNISLLAGAAQSYTNFGGGKSMTTERYSIQLRYKFGP